MKEKAVFDKLMREINDLKSDKEKLLKQIEKKEISPEDVAKKLGIDIKSLTDLSPETLEKKLLELKKHSEELLGYAERLDEANLNVENKDSKAVENFYKKIQTQNGEMSEQDFAKLRELFSTYMKSETQNVGQSCFHYNSDSCDSSIINAHSLQKGGPLKILASKKHEVIYIKKDEVNNERKPTAINIKNASTFKGFCHKHDSIFQRTIEKHQFNDSLEHYFLHSYRSFAYSYHAIKQEQDHILTIIKNGKKNNSKLYDLIADLSKSIGANTKLPVETLDNIKIGNREKEILAATRFESHKKTINKSLKRETYEDLEYLVFTKNHLMPIACSSWIKTHLNFGDGLLVKNNGKLYNGYPIIVTIIPEKTGQTHVILARFKSDSISEILFNRLNKLKSNNPNQFELILSSLILRHIENLYISPDWWNPLDSYLKERFINEMNLWKENFMELKPSSNVINLFDDIYKMKSN